MKIRNISYQLPLAVIVLVLFLAVGPQLAHGDAASINVSLSTGASCTPLMNGNATTYLNITPGQDVNFGFMNNSSSSFTVSVTAGSNTQNLTVTAHNFSGLGPLPGSTIVSVFAKPSCSGTQSTLYAQPASGSLSCRLQGSAWAISGSFSHVASGAALYLGDSSVQTYNPSDPDATTSVPYIQPAQAQSQTVTLYDNVNGGTRSQLAQASCPAYTAPNVPSGSSTPSSTSGSSPTSSTSAITPNASAKTSTASPTSSTIQQANHQATRPSSHTARIATSLGGGVILILIGFLLWRFLLNRHALPAKPAPATFVAPSEQVIAPASSASEQLPPTHTTPDAPSPDETTKPTVG